MLSLDVSRQSGDVEGEGHILPPCFMNSVSCHQISYDDVFVFRHVGQQSGFFNMATFDQKRLRAGAAQCSFSTNSGPASAKKARARFLFMETPIYDNVNSQAYSASTHRAEAPA